MRDALVILQASRQEAMHAVSIIEDPDEWHFMYDLMNRVIDHVAGLSPHVQITHEGQPVVALLDAAEAEHEADLAASDIDDGGVEDMERENDNHWDDRDTLANLGMCEADFR